MNGPQHLNLARRDLSDSYDHPGREHRLFAERELSATQAQTHALIALACILADAFDLNPKFEAAVEDALAVAAAAAVPDDTTGPEDADGPIWRCHSSRHSMRCQLAEGHDGDHEYKDALGGYAWTDDGEPVEVDPVPLEQLQPPVTAPMDALPSSTAALRLVPPYATAAPGAAQRGMC